MDGQRFGWRHVRHGCLVLEACFVDLKRRRQGKYRLVALGRRHPAHAETVAIPNALHLVVNRRARVPSADEVGMQGMHRTIATGVRCGPQGLPQDMASKKVAKPQVQALAKVLVWCQGFEFEQFQKLRQCRGRRQWADRHRHLRGLQNGGKQSPVG